MLREPKRIERVAKKGIVQKQLGSSQCSVMLLQRCSAGCYRFLWLWQQQWQWQQQQRQK